MLFAFFCTVLLYHSQKCKFEIQPAKAGTTLLEFTLVFVVYFDIISGRTLLKKVYSKKVIIGEVSP
jgi:hypothetical protein